MDLLGIVQLHALMERTHGRPEVAIGLIDGPVARDHPDLAHATIRGRDADAPGSAGQAVDVACLHGTFIAGVLCADRASPAPAICPGCTLLVHPVFTTSAAEGGRLRTPSVTPEDLADAIVEAIAGGARVLNLSLGLAVTSSRREQVLEAALSEAARRHVIVVAAAGNQGTLGGSAITQHPWVIPVAACDAQGVLLGHSNLGHAVGRKGLLAPGDRVTSLGPADQGEPLTLDGTSVATPFVTGALALLWSEFPRATAVAVRAAVLQAGRARRRTSVVPSLLNAWGAFQTLAAETGQRVA